MFNTPNVLINRLDGSFKTGPSRLVERNGPVVIQILEFLIQKGFDVNTRKDEKSPTLLESFVSALNINYEAIELLIKHGARKDVKHSVFKNKKTGDFYTLTEFVNEKKDEKLKKNFCRLMKFRIFLFLTYF